MYGKDNYWFRAVQSGYDCGAGLFEGAIKDTFHETSRSPGGRRDMRECDVHPGLDGLGRAAVGVSG